MRNILAALAGASFLAGAATFVFAGQMPHQTSHSGTKVYAYQKSIAPKPTASSAASNGPVTNSPSEHLTGSVPFGSPKWWAEMDRRSNGDGGQ